MHGQRIGYVRVSSFDQNPERQLEHVQVDRLFTDKASGKDTQRPELERLLAFAREGDTVVVHSMDRLARNLDDLRLIVQKLTKRGVRIEFVKENLTFTGEDSPLANLMLSVMGAFAEFERALIRERQREGIALAKQRGAYRGRKKLLSPEQCFWQLHLAHFGGLFWPPCKRASKSLIPGHLLSFLGTWSGAEPEGRSAGRCPQKRAPSLLPPSLLLRQRPTKAVGLLARLDDVSAVGNAIQQRLT